MKIPDQKITIAVDGFSSCGKSTFAKAIAHSLDYLYIDSGAMYRAVALFCIKNQLILNGKVHEKDLINSLKTITIAFIKNKKNNTYETCLNGENVEEKIRSVEVSNVVSTISKIKEVREKMVSLQRSIGKNKGIVMDGRDIGSVVFPDAEIKIFMTANPGIRAKRRYDELLAKGIQVSYDEIKKNIEERDRLDIHREISPLKKAVDAIELDNSFMSPEEQMIWFERLLEKLN
ncbi:MAG: (d)CMP kinase [Bacteroidales bacterium]|nr:(d)CMP kinase [Bacteroidales bacterium]